MSSTSGMYIKKAIPTPATQWFEVGDHPGDIDVPIREYGSACTLVVDYYHPLSSTDDLSRECADCKLLLREHGWISTLEGGHIVCPSDWILTDIDGTHHPVKDSVFQRTYEKVGDILD